ncbi:hypothetical protein [Citrobacter amalonaticus]|uniref:hypothetical protein n=1 Tax=Citrobacter amalonaticus TaxID=35703 RepID=UPI003EC0C1A5
MSTIQDIRTQLSTLVTEAHKVACSLKLVTSGPRLSSYTKRFVDFSARALLERYFPQPTLFSPRHITTRAGTKMKTNDVTHNLLFSSKEKLSHADLMKDLIKLGV